MDIRFVLVIFCLQAISAELADEMQEYEKECLGEDTFHCMDGQCIQQSQYCDNKIDCEDGSDENFCPDHNPNPVYCNVTHQFLCKDLKRCIPRKWICNNETECEDGSDEANCDEQPVKNTTCKGYTCGDGKCISRLWICDGVYDCADQSDESLDTCRHSLTSHTIKDGHFCYEFPGIGSRNYKCLDSSFCLPKGMMCDGMVDCRDGSDEGDFCKNWTTMCTNYTCGNDSVCTPERSGPSCICLVSQTMRQYNNVTRACEDVNDCLTPRPSCSHSCHNRDGFFMCFCDEGYNRDMFGYLCYATGPEAMLFFSTSNDIRYLKIKSKQQVTVASGIKQARGVSYDGKYLYWVETAQGHQSIVRAHLDNVQETKTVIVGLGLEDPGDVAIDYMGGHIYFSDAERGIISACRTDGSMCTTIQTRSKHPRFVTLDVRNGKMYWADWNNRPLIISARMDGSQPEILVESLESYATGLAMDAPNGRLYYVDKTIKVVKVDDKQVYALFEEPYHHPYSIAVFENTVFWSDWTSNTIQTTDKLHSSAMKRNILATVEIPIFGMHMYHPLLMNKGSNPCENHNCSHFCFITSNESYACGCPDGMELHVTTCQNMASYRPEYLIVGGGSLFTRIQYNTLGNPESHPTHFDVGRVQAMAYDSFRDALHVYDGQRKVISYINMSDFTLGLTHILIYKDLENVVDMDYDYASDSLYFLDAGRRFIEVVSLKTEQRALLYRFSEQEMPISFCILPDYGKLLVAVMDLEGSFEYRIHVDCIGLDGEGRHEVVTSNLKGPRIKLQYAHNMDNVYISDEGNGIIEYMHPEGSGRENYRELLTTITGLAITDTYVFWTDRRTPRLFWSEVHASSPRIRRIEFSIFPNNTQLHIQSTNLFPEPNNPILSHPCLTKHPCSDVCVQTPHQPLTSNMGYKCLCPPGLLVQEGKCTELATCKDDEFYCHRSNDCFSKNRLCDGIYDCKLGEDEENCAASSTEKSVSKCMSSEIYCNGKCIHGNVCNEISHTLCDITEFKCLADDICVERSQICDGHRDCPDNSDEQHVACDTLSCMESEFMCTSGSCILKSFKCDGDRDCADGSDEANCENRICPQGFYRCSNNECIELRKRCDGQQDCFDFSDEEECEEPLIVEVREQMPKCAAWEYACELNRSICLPLTARCNLKVDCPGGTDEDGCDVRCAPLGMFDCKQQTMCMPMSRVCNGKADCLDGSDETPEVCYKVNRTSHLYTGQLYPSAECQNGYLCGNGQCIEWKDVCDQNHNCFDGSDEDGLCFTACENNTCTYACQPTPRGPHCICPIGYRTHTNQSCVDIDECTTEVCSQGCHNIPGSFLCSCHHGYALRSDRRSCKAIRSNMSVLYVSGNTVRSISADGKSAVEYNDPKIASITDLDFNVRKNKLYVTSVQAKKLVEVNTTSNDVVITNIGMPTKVSVDWVTGNVYFVDSTPSNSCMRICDVGNKRCAKLQKLPSNAVVSALVVDPASRRMFYCVTRDLESVVWSATLTGLNVTDLTTVRNCTGLAVDSFKKKLYVAETGPMHIIRMNLEGEKHKTILTDDPHLEAPHGLAIFEDHIYFLVANSFKLSRCLLFGSKHCEAYLYRMFDANTFVIRHESVQRSDLQNSCEGFVCSNVCALDDNGPKCICDDGSLVTDGICPMANQTVMPLFNGWSYHDLTTAHHVSFSIITSVIILFSLYLMVFIYYHLCYRKKRNQPSSYMEVRYQTSNPESSTISPLSSPTFGPQESNTHEFVNPLQFVQNLWRQSFRRQRPVENIVRKPARPRTSKSAKQHWARVVDYGPYSLYYKRRPESQQWERKRVDVGTAGITIDVPEPTAEDLSDTESDLDFRDSKRIISKK